MISLLTSPPSSNRKSLVIISASTVTIISVFAAIFQRQRSKKRKEENIDADIELFAKQTERNTCILNSADDLTTQPWGLRNCHLATILAQFRPPPLFPSPFIGKWGKLAKRRVENISTPEENGGFISVEWIEPRDLPDPAPSSVPIVLILHGINGHSREPYVEQSALQIAVEKKWRAVIFNYGQIRMSDNKSTVLGGHNFMDGGDFNFLISYLRKSYHDTFLACIGFSMGGAKLVQYLGRTKKYCNLDSACVISSPLDFTTKNITVHGTQLGFIRRWYHFVISSALKLWIVRNYKALMKHPKVSTSRPFRKSCSGLLWWFQANRVTDIDHAITIHLKGYSDLNQYYQDASGLDRLRYDIKIPLLCITAKNDPVVPTEILPREELAMENENVFIVNTQRVGGHIGYWLPGKGCWATKASLSFFESVRKHSARKPKTRRLCRQHSMKAAHYLQRSSSTQLTDYFQLVSPDSCLDFDNFLQEQDVPDLALPTAARPASIENGKRSKLVEFEKASSSDSVSSFHCASFDTIGEC